MAKYDQDFDSIFVFDMKENTGIIYTITSTDCTAIKANKSYFCATDIRASE